MKKEKTPQEKMEIANYSIELGKQLVTWIVSLVKGKRNKSIKKNQN